uniref:Phytanoyl-CoA dioxygenase domain-containing protein 1 n=1 Tax=Phallusia mammillata TaxID=59560 RepID=A0A6F9DPD3_9ASCI|nr:phytanoyl-CoA dioxygenase domain-containing protein 1-like [Phallusia mammillata]
MKDYAFTDAQKQKFEDDGFLVIEDFFTSSQCDEMQKECFRIVDEMNPLDHREVFSTDDHEQMKSEYLLNSSDKIGFFWEKEAINNDGSLLKPKHESINKIGHALHALSPTFKTATFDPRVKEILRKLRFVRPVVPQSMYIFKPPGIGGEVCRHIDASFLYSEPLKLIGFWVALQDATEENGCMWFARGSHKNTEVTMRMVRNPVDGALPHTLFEGEMEHLPFDKYEITPVKRGSLVLIHGKVHHYSKKNTSQSSRHIYTYHVTESSQSAWSKRNWLQPSQALPFPPVYDDSCLNSA